MPDQAVGERVLVTGALGFVGGRLLKAIRDQRPGWIIAAPGIDGEHFDIRDAVAVRQAVADAGPTIVIHLAAISAVTAARDEPREAWDVNLGGALNLVEAIKQAAPQARLLHVSTAEVYGASLGTGATYETALLQPLNTYAASKAAADLMVRQEAAQGLAAVVARPFNHTGAGQSEAFALPAFAAQIARIEAGLQPPTIKVGALGEERDFLDVDDVVDAYLALLAANGVWEGGQVFNIAAGRSRRIGDMLQRLIDCARTKVEVEVDASRLRGRGVTRVLADASRLRSATGWEPRRPLKQTLQDLLDYERGRITPATV